MKPILWTLDLPLLGQIAFPAYFSLLTVGFAMAIILAVREAPKIGIPAEKIVDLSLYIIIFSIVGSRLFHVLFDGHLLDYINICVAPHTVPAVGEVPAHCTTDAQCGEFFLCNTAAGHCHPPRDCLLALKIWRGGLTYYGGFIAACLTTWVFCRINRFSLWRVADLYGHGTALGLFWGRMGCWYNGCCFGKVTASAAGVIFPRGGACWRHQMEAGLLSSAGAQALPVYPTQLLSAGLNLSIFFVIYFWMRPRKRFDGQLFWGFVAIKAVTRAVVEVLRDDDRGVYFGLLSTSQIVSAGMLALAIWFLVTLRRRAVAAMGASELG